MWLAVNNATIDSRSFLFSVLEKAIIRGNEASATTQAYTVIRIPALDSVMEKSEAMSVRSPIGMNSEVLNMNVEKVSPITGSHLRNPHEVFTFAISSVFNTLSGTVIVPHIFL